MSNYEAVIGLEVHVELKTQTKIFCGCSTEFGSEPNTNVCPVCLGLPGSTIVLNKSVLEYAAKAGLALNCDISLLSKFNRKHYFYPDMPKALQISQLEIPIAIGGHLDIEVEGESKRINIHHIHMEEDAGKLTHQGDTISSALSSLVDYNRSGVPLIEIVSAPDIRSGEEAKAYLEKLKNTLEYTDVSDLRMEQGSLRCDANVSIRPVGSKEFNTKTEIKNLNSFRAVQRAIEYEIERQIEVVEEGGQVLPETRTWDESKGITVAMRVKDEPDYRGMVEPDLPPIEVTPEWVEEIRATLPELPDVKKNRFIMEHGLPAYDAEVITSSRKLAEFYEKTVALGQDAKVVSNWIMGEFLRLLNANNLEITEVKITPEYLAKLLSLVEKGTISGKIGKKVFAEMFEEGKDPEVIIKEKGLVQISDEGQLKQVIQEVMADNPKSVEDYLGGQKKAMGFLVGQVMKATKGQANPGLVNKLLQEALEELA
ncbi:MAG: Asp-tRNA(Asn)/Glu-tRNA(Gln) amidotransferase subunit GatB [Clostridia bacterium]|nr:Asp-tRNA(Asn)/Glu-tRNA(Gln) amidotransferase subunit GatB [Clostridia bacterium]